MFELVSSDGGSPEPLFPFPSTPVPPALAGQVISPLWAGQLVQVPLDGLAFVQVESRIVLKTCVCSRDFHGWPL